MYVIGKTGTGKSTLLETLNRQDIENGEGLVLLDPYRDLVGRVLRAPEKRRNDLIFFDVPDRANPVASILSVNPIDEQKSYWLFGGVGVSGEGDEAMQSCHRSTIRISYIRGGPSN